MNTILSLIKRHSFLTFVLLSYLLSWWSAPFTNGQIIPYGPAVAAVIVVAVTSGRSGLRVFWQRVTRWRVAWYWYVIGPAMVASFLTGAYLLKIRFGASANPFQLPSIAILVELLLLGGLWEEPGWSGYALPTMQERYARRSNGALIATLVTGVVRAIWHLPLLIYGHIYWFDFLLFSIAFQVMISWLFNRSGGSVLVVMVFHFAMNIGGAFMAPVFSGAERMSYFALFVMLGWVIALVILWKSNLKMGLEDAQKTQTVIGHQAA